MPGVKGKSGVYDRTKSKPIKKKGVYILCKICQKESYVSPSRIKIGKGQYCSKKCYGISRKGIIPKVPFKKGNIPWNKGKKMPPFSEKRRKEMSEFRKGKFRGKESSSWKGGRIKTTQGYIMISQHTHPFCNISGYVMEQRLVVEKQIGRYLLPKEKCHHLGEKTNNRPHMLMAFVNHSAHMRFHKDPNSVKSSEIVFDGRNLT